MVIFPAKASPNLYIAIKINIHIQDCLCENSINGSKTAVLIHLITLSKYPMSFSLLSIILLLAGKNIKIIGPNKKHKDIIIKAAFHDIYSAK